MIYIDQHSILIIYEKLANLQFNHCEYNSICEWGLQSLYLKQSSLQFHKPEAKI
jgi:hypothetical protein